MTKLPLSVFIIAKDEADRIPLSVTSVIGWVDEVIVVDSGSTDATVAIAENLGARVLFHEWKGYGQQKIFAEGQCRNDWVLNIDADEEISPELAAEIQREFAHVSIKKIYRLGIWALYPYQKKLPAFPAGTTQVRLYNRKSASFKDSAIHDSVVPKCNDAVEIRLKGPVIHRSFRSHAHALEKINFYTSMQAEDLYAKGRNPSALKIVFTPFAAFFKCYVLNHYMFYGVDGFIQAWIYSLNRVVRLAKARERFQMAQR